MRFVGHESRLRKLEAAANPRGSKITLSNPFPDGEIKPAVLVGRCGGCDVFGASTAHSILDKALPDGFERGPDGGIRAVKSSEPKSA
jgi:hypothetical protein